MKSSHSKKVLWRFFSFLKPYWKQGCIIGVFSVITLGLDLTTPLLMEYLIDTVILGEKYEQLMYVVFTFFLVSELPSVVFFLQRKVSAMTEENISRDVRLRLFEKIEHLPVKYLHEHQTGQFVSKLTNDVDQLYSVMYESLIGIVLDILKLLVVSAILLSMHVNMALLCILLLPFYILTTEKFKKTIDTRYEALMKNYDKSIENYQDALENLYLVKSFVLETFEKTKIGQILQKYITSVLKFLNVYIFSQSLVSAIKSVTVFIVFGYGGYLVIHKQLSIGTLVAFNSISAMLFIAIDSLSNTYLEMQKSKVSLRRIFDILDEREEAFRTEEGVQFPIKKGDIRFENITFSYSESKENVLENFSLHIRAGEKIALIGPSGMGKSTITKLLMRFYDPIKGKIFVDDMDISNIDIASLRGQIGEVQQGHFIMKGTVMDNILFGAKDASPENAFEAAQKAYAHDFIMRLPKKYHEVISQNYANLSGGQLQRIALARAILKNPPLLIFDEATSALDPESEHLVLKSLEDFTKDKTTIIISHHLETLKKADRIIVLFEKKIVEEGTFDALMRKKGRFYEILTQKMTEKRTEEHRNTEITNIPAIEKHFFSSKK
ncbi:ABC transporter ATP-binding protein [Candidatus Peregrinibacteria bacterium]|nr:ABC transporter ATP-binding protein [Candidatus Peregrinibacteria bacterium]